MNPQRYKALYQGEFKDHLRVLVQAVPIYDKELEVAKTARERDKVRSDFRQWCAVHHYTLRDVIRVREYLEHSKLRNQSDER